ncbi:MAG: hypothetical protein WCC89_01615 [Candidatus Sulfotelmatobacter sp.]|jgi:hypothetical protein
MDIIGSYWIEAIGLSVTCTYTTDPLAPGNNVYANVSLSWVDTLATLGLGSPNAMFSASAFIQSWTFYEPDGSQSPQQYGNGLYQNAVFVNNCATITFAVIVAQAVGMAQANVFTL